MSEDIAIKKDKLSYKMIYFIFSLIFDSLYSMIDGKLVNSLTVLISNQENNICPNCSRTSVWSDIVTRNDNS